MEMKHNLLHVSSNGLEDSEKDVTTLKMIQGVGGHKVLKIWECLQKFLHCLPEVVK
jgi:hypothetical protein